MYFVLFLQNISPNVSRVVLDGARREGGVVINPRGVLPEIVSINPSPHISRPAMPAGRPTGVFRVNIMETDAKVFHTHSSACASKESFYLFGRATSNVSTWPIAIRPVAGGIDSARVKSRVSRCNLPLLPHLL